MKKLLIIDGNAIVHRAYHAYPPVLTDPAGQIINAVYGFFSMLVKVIEEVKPEYIVICFDRPAPTFRKTLYAGYQAHRPKMGDDLSGQIKRLHQALEMIGIPVFEVDGYEADDCIGTLSVQAQQQQEKIETVILSGDRDLLQLVNERTKEFMPITGITKFNLFDVQKVIEKFGITPSQIVDYKALVGDASDGYPGVGGIGPKTAVTLLNKYKTFENIYKHISEITGTAAEKLAKDAEAGALSKQLATIALDAPVHLDLEKASMQHFAREKVLQVCDMFGFNSIRKRLDVFPAASAVAMKKPSKEPHKDQLELI